MTVRQRKGREMKRARGTEVMVSLLPIVLGAALVVAGAVNGSRRNLLIGVALACTGIVGLVAPHLVPPAPGLGPERERARRAAAVILPTGIIYLALGLLLIIAIPASERGGATLLIIIFSLGMGVLNSLSGLGAIVRARRPDDVPRRPPTPPPVAGENGENV